MSKVTEEDKAKMKASLERLGRISGAAGLIPDKPRSKHSDFLLHKRSK